VAFGFSHTHRCSQRERRGGAGGSSPTLPPSGQLTRCFSAVAELLVFQKLTTKIKLIVTSPSFKVSVNQTNENKHVCEVIIYVDVV